MCLARLVSRVPPETGFSSPHPPTIFYLGDVFFAAGSQRGGPKQACCNELA